MFTETTGAMRLSISATAPKSLHDGVSETMNDKIKNTLLGFDDIERYPLMLRCADNVELLGDAIINLVDVLCDQYKEHDTDVVAQSYALIARCFDMSTLFEMHDEYEADLSRFKEWTCNNCSNRNFAAFVGGKMKTELLVCVVCASARNHSIVQNIKHTDSFVMVKTIAETMAETKEEYNDDIDGFMKSACKDMSLNLSCPLRNDTRICPSLWNLCKKLIEYKLWLYTI